MLTQNVLLGRKIAPLTAVERACLERAISRTARVSAGDVLVRKGDVLEHSTLLVRGFLSRYIDDRHGRRQFVSLHLAGDLVDMHAYPMRQLDHDIAALSDAEIAIMPHDAIREITASDAELARKLWFATLLDAAMHREWIFRLGRLDAAGRVCHFFAETAARLKAIGQPSENGFSLPMTQADLGEACALTSIHANRVLRSLREAGICAFRDGEVVIFDMAGLWKRGQFDPTYLYLDV